MQVVLNPESWTVICSVLGLGVLCVLIVRCRWSSERRLLIRLRRGMVLEPQRENLGCRFDR